MCMSTVPLNLQWDTKEQAYIGYGYKALYNKGGGLKKRGYEYNKWCEASGSTCNRKLNLKDRTIAAPFGRHYHPGYHIFLKRADAENYSSNNNPIYYVMFKNVVAFGKQRTNKNNSTGDCVVARHVKLLKKVS